MHLKKFEAPNTTEALALVKAEFGENAVILSTKTLDAGTAKQRIQVMAALDSDLEAAASSGPTISSRTMKNSPTPTYGRGGGAEDTPTILHLTNHSLKLGRRKPKIPYSHPKILHNRGEARQD